MYKLIPLLFLLTGCLQVDVDPVEAKVPDMPCFDGWQYDFIGQPIVDPYGAQVRCER